MPQFPFLSKEDSFLGLPTVGAAAPSGAVMARRWGKAAITGITPEYLSRVQECVLHLSSYRAPSAHRLAGWHSGFSGHPPGVPSRPHFLSGARLRSRASQGTRGAGILGQPHITVRCPPALQRSGPYSSPAAGLSPGLLSQVPLRFLPRIWGPQAGRGSHLLLPASTRTHRAPSHLTFSEEVSPGPAGGRRSS